MNRILWLVVIAMGIAACGGATTADRTPPTTETNAGQAVAIDLSGLGFEVHQAPG